VTAPAPVKTGPANAETDKDTGSRWYVHPNTGHREPSSPWS
jgi:hypothetical protein